MLFRSPDRFVDHGPFPRLAPAAATEASRPRPPPSSASSPCAGRRPPLLIRLVPAATNVKALKDIARGPPAVAGVTSAAPKMPTPQQSPERRRPSSQGSSDTFNGTPDHAPRRCQRCLISGGASRRSRS